MELMFVLFSELNIIELINSAKIINNNMAIHHI